MQEQKRNKFEPRTGMARVPAAAPETLPVFAGYLVLGLGYGIYRAVGPAGLAAASDAFSSTAARWNSILASAASGSFAPVSAF